MYVCVVRTKKTLAGGPYRLWPCFSLGLLLHIRYLLLRSLLRLSFAGLPPPRGNWRTLDLLTHSQRHGHFWISRAGVESSRQRGLDQHCRPNPGSPDISFELKRCLDTCASAISLELAIGRATCACGFPHFHSLNEPDSIGADGRCGGVCDGQSDGRTSAHSATDDDEAADADGAADAEADGESRDERPLQL